ncbi:HNH endonuclease signature motif containing protein [Salinibacterium soli]|uniref:DUF222 domain-containing protein n=1 Tax=Antiquaquibacter soli TaxID=3064523 RepID=A0ABT9BSN0_9MICO|nr:HNH endonuclease signature motif containing protein [Protaetiibacter sp. WY-16]MDO7882806.1 DUF222 domain-containing protein [Protaetiibacter sp. WY-16]
MNTPGLDAAIAAVRHVAAGLDALSPVDAVVAVESLGRVVDAARVAAAGRVSAGESERLGFASPIAAVATLSRVSEKTARSRLRIAAATREDRSLTGAELPAALPVVAAALPEIGLDAAEVIVRELDAVRPHLDPALVSSAERVMVNLASGLDATGVERVMPESVTSLAGQFSLIASAIDPDGARPREERARRRRSFRLGMPDVDGLVPVGGLLMPEVGSLLLGLMEAHRRSPRFTAEPELAHHEPTDSRTPAQRRHDALADIIVAAARAEGAPSLDGMPVSVIVTVAAADLADEDGLAGDPIGVLAGSPVPVSRSAVERFIDNCGLRLVRLAADGSVAGMSALQRCFGGGHRLQIAARDGARCASPGCTSPHYALQVHHVIPWREGGPTHIDNGILLCYWHHQRVDDGPWEWRMVNGLPEVRGPGIPEWTRISSPARVAA